MKEIRNLRRCWAGSSASLGSPASTSWSATALAWTSALFGRTLSVSRHLPSLGRLPPRKVRSPVVFLVATRRWPPVRCAAELVLLWGAEAREDRHLGALKVVFCPQAQADWWGLQRHCGCMGGRGLFAPRLTYPGSSREQGSHLPYTPTGRLRWRQSGATRKRVW